MDDYTLHQALESLAGNAYNPSTQPDATTPPEPISQTIDRWHRLFHLPKEEGVDRILAHRNNLTRTRISDAHWEDIEVEKSRLGYDREAYEYELELQKKKALLPELLLAETGDSGVTYLVELSSPLDTAEKVQRAAGMETVPMVVGGYSVEEGRAVSLCCIDGEAKSRLLRWAADEGGFEPNILVNPKSLR